MALKNLLLLDECVLLGQSSRPAQLLDQGETLFLGAEQSESRSKGICGKAWDVGSTVFRRQSYRTVVSSNLEMRWSFSTEICLIRSCEFTGYFICHLFPIGLDPTRFSMGKKREGGPSWPPKRLLWGHYGFKWEVAQRASKQPFFSLPSCSFGLRSLREGRGAWAECVLRQSVRGIGSQCRNHLSPFPSPLALPASKAALKNCLQKQEDPAVADHWQRKAFQPSSFTVAFFFFAATLPPWQQPLATKMTPPPKKNS